MIALDTPVLLRLLRGEAKVRGVLRELQGEELATTEWNLLELEGLSNADPTPGRERRRAALERLRRRITVIPIDERTTERFGAARATASDAPTFVRQVVLAAVESRGARLWLTDRRGAEMRGRWKVRPKSVL